MKEYFEHRQLQGPISIHLPERQMTWTADKLTIVKAIIGVVTQYAGMGYRLTLRQLYYQLVQANVIPNHDKVYAKLSGILDDCRYNGKVDWDIIEDRGRVPKLPYAVDSVEHAVKDTIDAFRLDRQKGQPVHIELWTEKDAISNILYRVTSEFQVRLVINKGYTSSSAAYDAYERFVTELEADRKVVILYFGDHDPSGLDMVRDIRERMITFLTRGSRLWEIDSQLYKAVNKWWFDDNSYQVWDLLEGDYLTERQCNRVLSEEPSAEALEDFEAAMRAWYFDRHDLFKIIPIGLSMQQIKQYKLPPNPAKITDPRAKGYIAQFGQQSWEVDALRPDILTQLVRDSIVAQLDASVYNGQLKVEKQQLKVLKEFLKSI